MERIFAPHELKTIEVDVEEKIFKINGDDFGEGCTGFTVSCQPEEWTLRVEVDTTVILTSYDPEGDRKGSRTYPNKDSWL